ncbi:hypothetical protein [Nocardia asteroides]|uniref:hypothetical protein n=1 Tax=Nocardia asteroides TaxID=1824 RepID=UPI001E5E44DE|nr:hypothetical protein [Nocardia asteroides]UGT54247.1 hypothetical protein LTT85_26945 [Nocardia asteroides]
MSADRIDDLLLEIEAAMEYGPTLADGVRNAFQYVFDTVEDDLCSARSCRRSGDAADDRVRTRVARLIREIEPTLDPVEAQLAAGSVVRIALAYLIDPELPRPRAVDQVTALALTILDGVH